MLSDDIPYLEMLYRFVFGEKRSYYDLQVTKDVKPNKRNERKDERGASTRPDARMTCEGDMSKVEVRTLPVRGRAVTERPQRNLISKPTCIYRLARGSDPLDSKGALYQTFQVRQCSHNRIIDMNELLELKHRIDNCTDDLQSFELKDL